MNIAKWTLVILGIIFLLIGILGLVALYVPMLQAIFTASLWQTIVELILGIIAIVVAFVKQK